MCGFIGFLAYERGQLPHAEWIRPMLATIAHRGPDDEGILIDHHAALGFRRLAILDLTDAAHQPMTSRDGKHSVVFNGEIYNFVELRAELRALGHQFSSSGDTEVLLAAYRQWGTACVHKLVGMFAFCVVDRHTNTYFLARDRFGIKPLFYLRHSSGVLVASELKAIRASGLWGGELNMGRFARFLAFNRTEEVSEDDETYFAGVLQLRAGHSCVINAAGEMRTECYWQPAAGTYRGERSVVDEFRARFDDAMRLHTRSDVKVGAMLSGGMDSCSIACAMAARGTTDRLQAFSYVTEEYDETEQITAVIEQTEAVGHVTRGLEPHDFWTRLRELVWHHDEPVHSASALIGFELYRMAAAEGIKVVLSGQGADETLGGYFDYYDHVYLSEILRGRLPSALRQMGTMSAITGKPMKQLLVRTAALGRAHLLARVASYRQAAAARRLDRGEGRPYVSQEILALAKPKEELPTGQTLERALVRAVTGSPLPHYLRAEDRNSMAHGVESRVPFLDHRLVELAMQLPPAWKMYDGWNKRVLREAMAGRIPDAVRLRRQKFGFPTAVREWFSGPLAGGLRDIIEDGAVMQTGWFDQKVVRQALVEHLNGRAATKLLFNVAQLNAWCELHNAGWPQSARTSAPGIFVVS